MKVDTAHAIPIPAQHKKRSIGEELFLIHLRRDAHMHDDPEDDDDVDVPSHPPQRKRSRSIGEELYSIHLKRSEGCLLEKDMTPTDGDFRKRIDDAEKEEVEESSECVDIPLNKSQCENHKNAESSIVAKKSMGSQLETQV